MSYCILQLKSQETALRLEKIKLIIVVIPVLSMF